jgi:hypothetical protein
MGKLVKVLLPVLLAASALSPAERKPGEKAVGPPFKFEEYTLVWGKLKASSEVDLGKESESKYTVELDGTIETPAKVDAVAVAKKCEMKSALDDKGQDVIKPAKLPKVGAGGIPGATPSLGSPSYKTGSYNAIHANVGQVEVSKTDLIRDATKIKKMTVETEVVIAKKRVEAKLPAVVMEDFKDLNEGVSVRITGLQMSTKRELTVNAAYKRNAPGSEMPFIEAIYATDPEGKEIGGGRWTEGDPFGKQGTMTYKFKLAGDQVHSSLRFIIVSESTSKALTFELAGIFSH